MSESLTVPAVAPDPRAPLTPKLEPTFRQEAKQLLRLAAPLAAVQVGTNFFGIVDTAIVGRLGAVPLAAVGLGHSVFFGVTVVGSGIMMGFDPLMSQALGARDEVRARVLLWQSVWLALIVGAVLTIPLLAISPFLHLFGIERAVAEMSCHYLLVRIIGLVPLLLFLGIRSYLQAKAKTAALVWGILAANLLNIAVTWWLAFGGEGLPAWLKAIPLFGDMPALGATGAAVASTLCVILQLALLVAELRKLPVAGFERWQRRLALPDLNRAARIGLPIGLQMMAEVGFFVIVTFLAGRLGARDLAAHQIAITLAGMTFSCAVGVGAAASVRVGHGVGAFSVSSVRRAGFTAFGIGGSVMALSALCFFLWPAELAALLSNDLDVLALATPLLAVAAFFQLSDGFQAIGAGVLRGAGDVTFTFVTNLIGHYAIGLPVALSLGIWGGRGVTGLWWGLCAGLTAVGVVLIIRFVSLSKHPIRPLEMRRGEGERHD
ncbi:MAG: MATE family efflux transporter [Myxococcales bacterium]|jgi:MATE family multidrug resistance protein|nr:MATE family efflux transporter [Myxococcales bacterium]